MLCPRTPTWIWFSTQITMLLSLCCGLNSTFALLLWVDWFPQLKFSLFLFLLCLGNVLFLDLDVFSTTHCGWSVLLLFLSWLQNIWFGNEPSFPGFSNDVHEMCCCVLLHWTSCLKHLILDLWSIETVKSFNEFQCVNDSSGTSCLTFTTGHFVAIIVLTKSDKMAVSLKANFAPRNCCSLPI